MGKCVYTWEKWYQKNCQYETWEKSDKFCIFHDPSPEKDINLFKEKLKKQMDLDRKEHSFVGFVFPGDWDYFKNYKFEINCNFSKAVFQGNVNFDLTTFEGKTNFNEVTFQKNVTFNLVNFQNASFFKTKFKQVTNFDEAIFKNETNFNEAVFQGQSYFRRTSFKGPTNFLCTTFQNVDFSNTEFQKTNFNDTVFKEKTNFNVVNFIGNTSFSLSTFENDVSFMGTQFRDFVNFLNITFKNVDFRGIICYKQSQLLCDEIGILDLRYSNFFFRSVITANLSKTLFHCAFIDNVNFNGCKWPKKYIIHEEQYMNKHDINLSYSDIETIYRNLKKNMQNSGNYTDAGEFYYREMEMKRKGAKNKKDLFLLQLYKIIAGYGEKPLRTIISSLAIIFICTVFYWIFQCLEYSVENPTIFRQIKDSLYFSFVTFTTLGLGDIHPVNDFGRAFICIEALLGAFFMALFVVVFVRKMAR
jgi:uncharacterized protein YjbI with pentapeptide repeats